MTVSTPSSNLGRHVFGAAALAFGLITLAWHDYNDRHQLRYIVYAAAAAQIFGRAAIQFRRTAKTGQLSLVRLILSSPYCACQESSPNHRSTIAGATSSSSSLS